MKFIITVLVVYASLDANVCQTNSAEKPYDVVSRSNWDFTNAVYASIAKATEPTSNILFSPLSIQVIMSVCYIGAGGKTAKQMAKALKLPNKPGVVKLGFRKLIRILTASEKISVVMANKVYPSRKYLLSKNFLNITKSFFYADVETLNYGDRSNAARIINAWVMEKTHSKISGIVTPDSLKSSTRLLLVNTIYFQGDWAVSFAEEDTYIETFYVYGKVKKQFPTMHATRKFGFKEDKELGARVLELTYKDKGDTSLLIILPTERDGLRHVEAKLTKLDLNKFVLGSEFRAKELRVSLPKFKLTHSTLADKALRSMGMKDLFGLHADLSKMTSQTGMYVDDVLHKAVIEVNEEGTVAAAASAAGAGFRHLSPTAEDFVVDHPFVFALVSRRAKVVLFAGRFTGDGQDIQRMVRGASVELASKAWSSPLTTDPALLWAMVSLLLVRTFHARTFHVSEIS